MKYVTITAKHHDGFALWDSQVSEYDLGDHTHPKRDVIAELAAACKKHGLKLGLYYSHWVDWEHAYGWDHTNEIYPLTEEQYDQYWQEKVIPQMRELLTQYGDIGIIWFDMWIHHSRSIVTEKQLLQLKGLIRELQPNCLVNSRLGLSIEEDSDIDFKTLGDNQLGDKKEEFPWQSPATVAHSWGFHALEDEWKSTTTLLHSLIGNVSLNGNMMLNIGPRANGKVPYEIKERLLEMGSWLKVHGESIYGAKAFELSKNQHDWGKITCKTEQNKTKLYLHIYNWPLNQQIPITGIIDQPKKAYLLSDQDQAALAFTHDQALTLIDLQDQQADPYVSVVVLEYDQYPKIKDELVGQSVYGGYALTPHKAHKIDGDDFILSKKKFGSIPERVVIKNKSQYQWTFYVDRPVKLKTDISYSFTTENGQGNLLVKVENQTLNHEFQTTRKVVGEPNSNWQIPGFESYRIGELSIDKAGYYKLTLEINPEKNQPLEFQWIWLEPNK